MNQFYAIIEFGNSDQEPQLIVADSQSTRARTVVAELLRHFDAGGDTNYEGDLQRIDLRDTWAVDAWLKDFWRLATVPSFTLVDPAEVIHVTDEPSAVPKP